MVSVKRATCLKVLAIFFTVALIAGVLTGTARALDAQSYVESTDGFFAVLQLDAQRGNIDAQYLLSALLTNGIGAPQDMAGAEQWFAEAYKNDHPLAIRDMCANSIEGFARESIAACREGANLGDPMTLFFLGYAYRLGGGVDLNEKRAAELFEQSAEQNVIAALLVMAAMYQEGIGVGKNPVKAVRYLRRASALGSPEADRELAFALCKGAGVHKDVTAGIRLFERAARYGDGTALYYVAGFYEYGLRRRRDLVKAYAYLLLAENRLESGETRTSAQNERVVIGRGLSEQQIERAEGFVRDWVPDAVPLRDYVPLGLTLIGNFQTALTRHGFDPGPVDGLYGPKTTGAIDAFGRQQGIEFNLIDTVSIALLSYLLGAVGHADPASYSELRQTENTDKRPLPQSQESPSMGAVTSSSPQEPEPDSADDGGSSGTGFYINDRGHVLTNQHVVSRCRTILVGGSHAEVVASDPDLDLALLRVEGPVPAISAFRLNSSIAQGETVYAYGFPLNSLVSNEPSISTGLVTALTGLQNSPLHVQISAPVQPGSSGSPVFDSSGRVIGIVTMKLNALATAMVTGDIPQNINFAIRASIAKLFLDAHGIEFSELTETPDIDATAIADQARPATPLVVCSDRMR